MSKNILVVVGLFPKLSETFIVNQITGLIDMGNDVRIYSHYRNSKAKSDVHDVIHKYKLMQNVFFGCDYTFKVNKIKRVLEVTKLILLHRKQINWVVFFKVFNTFKYGKDALNLSLFYTSFYFLFNKMPDVIHAHFGPSALVFARLKELDIIPRYVSLIVTFHGYDLEPDRKKYYLNLYKTLFEQTKCFTVNTEYLKDILFKIKPNLKNVKLLPVGPNLNVFNIKHLYERKSDAVFNIVYCGRLIGLKGGRYLIAIAKKLSLAKFNFHIHIIGDGELREELEFHANRLKIKDEITFYGALSQEKVKKIFMICHVFILPGIEDEITKRAETQGLVIQEAQAMGLPVLVSDAGGMKYGMLDNETGYVLPQKDIDAFVAKIRFLIYNEKDRFSMGKRGVKYVKHNFNQNKLTAFLYNNVYLNQN